MRYMKQMRPMKVASWLGLSTALAFGAQNATAQSLDALVAAAKKEGTLTFYSSNPVPITENVVRAFEKKYGITVEALALPGGTLLQRFASEQQARSFNADVILGAGFDEVVTNDYIPKGWMVPIQSAGIPVLSSNQYPAQFINKSTATVGYAQFNLIYNSDKISKADAPKSYAELADPKYAGKICLADPAVADVYIELWDRVRIEYGDKVLAGITANRPKIFPAAAATAAALAAGECVVAAPITPGGYIGLPKQAPVAVVSPEVTTGADLQIGALDPAKIRHPNAAKLFTNYLMSPEGNKELSAGLQTWVLNPEQQASKIAGLKAPPDSIRRKAEILKLMGR